MKARIRNRHGVDIRKIFSAKLCGGTRGYGYINALEIFSNVIFPCITLQENFHFICEPMNSRLNKLIQDGKVKPVSGQWLDCYSQITNEERAGTILTNVDSSNLYFTTEKEVLNTDSDGLATTLTTAHHYSGNIINPKRGQKEMGVKETSSLGFRIRKLTLKECFRLMGVNDTEIDKIQAAGISKSQQYKLAENSIVVDVLAAIFRKMFINKENESNELTLF